MQVRTDEQLMARYAEGDLQAKQTAANVIESERHFRQVVASSHKAIRDKRYATPVHKFGSLFSIVEPKLPDAWFRNILRNPAENDLGRYARHLPAHVRQSAEQYQTAKSELHKLNGRL